MAADLNDAIHAFVPLLGDLGPVRATSPRAHGPRRLLPRAGELRRARWRRWPRRRRSLFANLDTTFRALASVAVPSLQETISLTPPMFEATINGAPVIRPFLRATAHLFRELRPGVATLPQSAPVLADAFEIGTRNLPGTAALDQRTVTLAKQVAAYGETPSVQQGLDRLTLTLSKLGPPLAFLTPAQTTCNYVTLFLRNTASVLSEHVSQGTLLRFVQVLIDQTARLRVGAVQQAVHRAGDRRLGPAARQPVPQHRRARPAGRVRGRQRAVHQRPRGDRQPARQDRPQDRDDHAERRMRRHRSRVSNLAAGAIAAVAILAVCYLVFGGSLPFQAPASCCGRRSRSRPQLHLGSPVRIAGVNVGTVTAVKRVSGSSTAAVATMTIQPSGLPIHADATADIRPRLFLEGNFYVDLKPGTPAAPVLSSGATLPASQTTGPVQLDRVLSSLNSNSRENLQTLLQGLGASLDGSPTAAQDATQDPSVRGLTAGEALNQSLNYAAGAFKASTIVNQALLGEQPHDLSGVVAGNAHIFTALASEQRRLQDLVTTFNATMGALAARQQDLSTTISLLPPLLRTADSALGPLQASFGPTQRFAAELTPSIKQLAPTITAGLPWIAQATPLMSQAELGGLLASLTPAVQGTASTLISSEALLNGSDTLAKCFVHTVIPTGNERIQDPPLTTGLQVYQELFQSAVGLAGTAQNFDGNGRYVRASAGGGADRVQTGSLPGGGPLYGNAVAPPLGTRPAYPGKQPPLNRTIPCFKNAPANLNAAQTGVGP